MTRTKKQSTEAAVREIRRKTRRKFAPEEKVRIVLEGLRGVPLTSAANIREIWPDGTVSLSRPYIRLDRQPEATRRIYAEEYGVPLRELGLEPEPDADVVAIETAQDETSGEILSRNGSRAALSGIALGHSN